MLPVPVPKDCTDSPMQKRDFADQLLLCPVGDSQRQDLETHIAKRYRRRHQARIREFLPWLLALQCGKRTRTVVGIRAAAGTELFLEHYLDGPVEQRVSEVFQRPVVRGQVTEIGNLASSHCGASYRLLTLLAALLHQGGFRWITFTATPRVEQLIRSIGFSLLDLGAADAGRIGAEAADWGTYYGECPRVMAGDLVAGMEVIHGDPGLRALIDAHATDIRHCLSLMRCKGC